MAASICISLAAPLLAATPARARPVVLELFTSLACSSCPPADALLATLADQPGLIALDLHVDYWDRLGWPDPFSSPAYTARQQNYAARFGRADIFTPELVVNGTRSVVGSDEPAVRAAIAAEASGPTVPLTLRRTPAGLEATAGAGNGRGTLLLAAIALRRTTHVQGGENGGRTLSERNIVLRLTTLGDWTGNEVTRAAPPQPGDTAALLLQAPSGVILGAAWEK